MVFNSFCLNSYLTFRYIPKSGIEWLPGVKSLVIDDQTGTVPVSSSEDIYAFLEEDIKITIKNRSPGILLSSGIDSAILASFLPSGTPAYTIRFEAEGAIDESQMASEYAGLYNLDHKVIDVRWEDYEKYMDNLMLVKGAPLHAVEVGLFKASREFTSAGVDLIIVGNGADSTFGGLDKLLSVDYTCAEFIERYTFVSPNDVLKDVVDLSYIFEDYITHEKFNTVRFLKTVHGLGIVQAFGNALGLNTYEPYEKLILSGPLDINKIRSGQSKYVLRELFNRRFPKFQIPEKIAFARPMDLWLEGWTGPVREEFLDNIDISKFTGDQKWLIYCLERFMNINE